MSRMAVRLFGVVLVAVLVASACSSDPEPDETVVTETAPAEVADTSARSLDGLAAGIYGGDCVEPDGRELTVYSGRSEDLMEPIFEAFECESGVELSIRWAGSADLALLLHEEGERTPADVFLSRSPGPVGFLESGGLLGEIDGAVLDLVDSQNRSADNRWVGFSGRKRVAVYSLDNVDASELPESVFDLTGEQWRGRVAIPATNGSFADWFTVFRDQHGTEVATQWIEDMAANDARYYPNNRSIVEAASRGEIDIGLVNHYYNYQEAAAGGDAHRAENHDFVGDDIGSTLIITAATITASSENVDEATELLGYLLMAPIQRYITDETFEYPLAAGVEPAAVLSPLGGLEIGTVDFDALGADFEETTRIIEASGIANQ